jgi:hypothetical protein
MSLEQISARAFRRFVCTAALLTIGSAGFCQPLSSTMSSLRELGFDPAYLYYAAGAGVLLVGFYIVLVVVSKNKSSKADRTLSGLASIDISGMKSKGLLTEEELAKVRQAMSRQVTRQLNTASAKPQPGLKADMLLLTDPDVQRLEALADAKQQVAEKPILSNPPPQGSRAPANDPFAPVEPVLSPGGPEPDVILPPDVQSMADMGLISPEEVENIKQRIKAKKQAILKTETPGSPDYNR